ncbi:unnamed protein product [Dibothriocephalus latus]|uniref:Uncharacterized protein n=1 Tax=Dibothriocephalus latus TaxID=60516 RepID=A0A3P7Q3R3_DIBLA|nr:unnamed protein product [Dibothriocephalus latus]
MFLNQLAELSTSIKFPMAIGKSNEPEVQWYSVVLRDESPGFESRVIHLWDWLTMATNPETDIPPPPVCVVSTST